MTDALEDWEIDFRLRKLDAYLGGGLLEAADMLEQDHTSKLFGFIRDDLAGRAGLAHEQRYGLLTPENQADQARREAEGRAAAAADTGPRMEYANPELAALGQRQTARGASPQCNRGIHAFGTLRGPNGEAECRDCGTVFVFPK